MASGGTVVVSMKSGRYLTSARGLAACHDKAIEGAIRIRSGSAVSYRSTNPAA